jgi:hypothetical protein
MGRSFDDLFMPIPPDPAKPRRRGRRRKSGWLDETPEGLVRPPSRPMSADENNPLHDPLARTLRPPRPLDASTPPRRDRWSVEFTPVAIIELRHTFHASQRQFARMFGISVETLRNWEQGKRRPQGPARALLRVAKANPSTVARTLWRYRRAWWLD